MDWHNIKKLISLGVLALIAGTVKLDGAAGGFRIPPQEIRGAASSPLAEAESQCSLFEQTDADILLQQDDGGEVLFSGCGGFF